MRHRTRIATARNYRREVRDAAAEILSSVGEVVRGAPRVKIQTDQMPRIIVRVVSDEAEGGETLRGSGGVAVTLEITVLSSKSEDEIDDLLTKADNALFADQTLGGKARDLLYDGFELEDPDTDGDRPVFSGTASYIAGVTR